RAAAAPWLARLAGEAPSDAPSPNHAALIEDLQALMQQYVGPFRQADGLRQALRGIEALKTRAGTLLPGGGPQDPIRLDALDIGNMLLVAEAVARSALARQESRGAHQREDYPFQDEAWTLNQTIAWRDGHWTLASQPVQGLAQQTTP
ncbi:FAD-binding protein, partial [Bordetella hinzii]